MYCLSGPVVLREQGRCQGVLTKGVPGWMFNLIAGFILSFPCNTWPWHTA